MKVFRVPLLKGAYYDIESTLPMFVVDQSSDNIDIWCNDCWYYHSPSASHRFFRINYYVDFWLENNGNLCELKSSENIGAAVSEVTGACCMSDITPLGFRWCCNESCNCGGELEHYLNGLVSWEGYTTWLGSWVYCACAEDDSSEEESEPPISLSLSIPRVIFTNNDGTAEKSDLAPLNVKFTSTQPTNGYVCITCNQQPDGVMVWVDDNKTQQADFPVSIQINGATSFTTNFYVEGTASSLQKDELVSSVGWWEEDGNTKGVEITRSSTVYYPVANVINSTLYDNGRLCNPSGIVVGSNACFVVEFPDLAPPSSDIKWTVVEGAARFVGGDTGPKVYVTSDVPNQIVKLRVQIGDCVSRPIEFTAFTVEPLSVKTTVWIVGNKEGTYFARTENEVRSMMAEVNRIYEQIGVSFYIDSISYTNKEDWLDIEDEEYDTLRRRKKINRSKERELTNLSKNTGGIELYFINKIAGRVLGLNPNTGAIFSTNANEYTLAHEIGHSFGLKDVYPRNKYYREIKLENSDFDFSDMPDDFSNGTHKRYYESDLKLESLMSRLLMYGYNTRARGDLSAGYIRGFNDRSYETYVDVGFFTNGQRKLPSHQ